MENGAGVVAIYVLGSMQINLWLVAALFLVLAAFGSVVFGRKPGPSVRFISWNIRYDTAEDGEHRWEERKTRVVRWLKAENAPVIGLQEVLHGQLMALQASLGPNYDWTGAGRDDGKTKGEYSPIAVDTTRMELLQKGMIWLSETPGQPSKGWDAALPRVCSWVQLRDKRMNELLWVFNTHFDHQGEEARRKSAQLINDSIQAWCSSDRVVLLGDFNETADGPVWRTFQLGGLTDSKLLCEQPSGLDYSFHGFKPGWRKGKRIDFIWLRGFKTVHRHETPALLDEKSNYASDHAPVVVEAGW